MKVKVRSQYRARKGKLLIQADLSQAETWIVAFYADEKRMQWSLMNSDIHRDTACNAIFFCKPEECTSEMRYIGKQSNHALSYDMQPPRWAQTINKKSDIPPYVTVTVKQTTDWYKKWHAYYNIKGWHQEVQDQLAKDRTIITPYGRKRYFYEAWGRELWKEAYAHIPQSTVADHANGRVHPDLGIKGGVLEIDRQLVQTGACDIVQQGHDSVIVETPTAVAGEIAERVRGLMRRPLIVKGREFTIPVDVEMGERWGEMEKVRFAA